MAVIKRNPWLRALWQPAKPEPFKGATKINNNSSLRKLMRAARNEKVAEARIGIIARAQEQAQARAKVYRNRRTSLDKAAALV